MQTPQYITQLSGEWIKNVTAAANLEVGKGLRVDKAGDRMTISFDENAFKLMVYAIIKKTVATFSYVAPANYTLDYEL